MPKGLIVVNAILVAVGSVLSWLFWDTLHLIPFTVSSALCVVFNLFIGSTNSPDNTNSKFRKWLFGH